MSADLPPTTSCNRRPKLGKMTLRPLLRAHRRLISKCLATGTTPKTPVGVAFRDSGIHKILPFFWFNLSSQCRQHVTLFTHNCLRLSIPCRHRQMYHRATHRHWQFVVDTTPVLSALHQEQQQKHIASNAPGPSTRRQFPHAHGHGQRYWRRLFHVFVLRPPSDRSFAQSRLPEPELATLLVPI